MRGGFNMNKILKIIHEISSCNEDITNFFITWFTVIALFQKIRANSKKDTKKRRKSKNKRR